MSSVSHRDWLGVDYLLQEKNVAKSYRPGLGRGLRKV
jgi:hypothetical protein